MDDDKYINSITLEYLLNPSLYERINQRNLDNNFIYKDIKFYRKRICQITKDMCKGDYINDNFKTLFLNYVNTIIYYFKQLDEKDILQSDYKDFEFTPSISPHLLDLSYNYNADNLLVNSPPQVSNLDNFVKKININNKEKILPKKRVANIKDPDLKNKGVKKKIYS